MLPRKRLISSLAQRLLSIPLDHPLRVGIDGVDASGKTSLADELAEELVSSGREIIRASIDRFHQPRAVRYRLGPDSPEGYYLDSFNLSQLRRELLDPLGPSGRRLVVTERFDVRANSPLDPEPLLVSPDAILLFDGIFLHRPELLDTWDFTIFIEVTYDTVVSRAIKRDFELFGSAEEVVRRYRTRYIPAQQAYLAACSPVTKADIVILNDDLANPQLKVPPGSRAQNA